MHKRRLEEADCKFEVVCAKRGRLRFEVKVFPTLEGMRGYIAGSGNPSPRALAICRPFDNWVIKPGEPDRRTRLIGELIFHQDAMRMGIIAHESVHAALAYLRRRLRRDDIAIPHGRDGGGAVHDAEEALCWVAGNIAAQVTAKWYEWRDAQADAACHACMADAKGQAA